MTKNTAIESPEQKLKELEEMSVPEVKEAIIQTCRRQARAEVDLKYYNDSYKAVIKEEKETRESLMNRLEVMMEADRLNAVREGWLSQKDLAAQVEDMREAIENDDTKGMEKRRGFRVVSDVDDESEEPEAVTGH
jgi:hypothetical protein